MDNPMLIQTITIISTIIGTIVVVTIAAWRVFNKLIDPFRREMKADYEGLKTIVQNGTKEHEYFRSSIQDLNKEILEIRKETLVLQKEILTRLLEK